MSKIVHYTTEIDIDFSYNPHLKPDSLIMRVEKYLIIFYNDILMTKVFLGFFFMRETRKNIHNSTFEVEISV